MSLWNYEREVQVTIPRVLAILVTTVALCGCQQGQRPEAATTTTRPVITGRLSPAVRELSEVRVSKHGMPNLIGEVQFDGIVRYLRPHVGQWPDSAETTHVYYYLDTKRAVSFAPGQPERVAPLSEETVGFMRDLAN